MTSRILHRSSTVENRIEHLHLATEELQHHDSTTINNMTKSSTAAAASSNLPHKLKVSLLILQWYRVDS